MKWWQWALIGTGATLGVVVLVKKSQGDDTPIGMRDQGRDRRRLIELAEGGDSGAIEAILRDAWRRDIPIKLAYRGGALGKWSDDPSGPIMKAGPTRWDTEIGAFRSVLGPLPLYVTPTQYMQKYIMSSHVPKWYARATLPDVVLPFFRMDTNRVIEWAMKRYRLALEIVLENFEFKEFGTANALSQSIRLIEQGSQWLWELMAGIHIGDLDDTLFDEISMGRQMAKQMQQGWIRLTGVYNTQTREALHALATDLPYDLYSLLMGLQTSFPARRRTMLLRALPRLVYPQHEGGHPPVRDTSGNADEWSMGNLINLAGKFYGDLVTLVGAQAANAFMRQSQANMILSQLGINY